MLRGVFMRDMYGAHVWVKGVGGLCIVAAYGRSLCMGAYAKDKPRSKFFLLMSKSPEVFKVIII